MNSSSSGQSIPHTMGCQCQSKRDLGLDHSCMECRRRVQRRLRSGTARCAGYEGDRYQIHSSVHCLLSIAIIYPGPLAEASRFGELVGCAAQTHLPLQRSTHTTQEPTTEAKTGRGGRTHLYLEP